MKKISRFKKVPLLGPLTFSIMDYFQRIKPFYPIRDLSKPTTQQLVFISLIKKGLGKDLIEKLNETKLPIVTTFFVAMYAAEEHGYQGDIYSIVCDADISRAWAPVDPAKSKSKFLVPNTRVKERLMMYGVLETNIFITGFPLPLENIGDKREIVKSDLARRIVSLDPIGTYRKKEKALVKSLVPEAIDKKSKKPLVITFAVGGAGAQKEIGALIIEKLSSYIKKGNIVVNLVAGVRPEVRDFFEAESKRNDLLLNKEVNIIFKEDKVDYFKIFSKILKKTDILWTKPSELSFYSGLGLPIIMSETVGSQEDFNKEWLLSIGAGVASKDPRFVDQWLPEMLKSGRLARAAMDAYLNAENRGVYNIEKVLKIKK